MSAPVGRSMFANGVFNIFKTMRNDFKDFVDVYFEESEDGDRSPRRREQFTLC